MDDLDFQDIERITALNPCMEDIEDPRDFQFSEIMGGEVALPVNFSLRDEMTPVKNQGSRGTCVGFAATGITEFHNAKEKKNAKLNLSEEYMFRRIKEIDLADYNYSGYGAYLRSGAKALQKYGTCYESTGPYNFDGAEDSWKDFQITPKMDTEASEFRMKSYLKVSRNKEEIKRALVTTKSPLLFGVTLYESYRQAKKNGGRIPVPKAGEKVIGGHAMEGVGYSDYGILAKNSWGSSWGDNGYIWWPWEALDKLHSSAWSFVDLITNPHVIEEKMIEKNKEGLLEHQKEAWEAAIKQGGLITGGTRPKDVVTKGDLMVFFQRVGLIKKD